MPPQEWPSVANAVDWGTDSEAGAAAATPPVRRSPITARTEARPRRATKPMRKRGWQWRGPIGIEASGRGTAGWSATLPLLQKPVNRAAGDAHLRLTDGIDGRRVWHG